MVESPAVVRRLAAILAADVAGYSQRRTPVLRF